MPVAVLLLQVHVAIGALRHARANLVRIEMTEVRALLPVESALAAVGLAVSFALTRDALCHQRATNPRAAAAAGFGGS